MAAIIDRIKQLYKEHREVISYLFFGGLTTVVNFASFYIFNDILEIGELYSNVIAWFISVFFAYITNNLYVFQGRGGSFSENIKKIVSFYSFRAVSGGIDQLMFWLLVLQLGMNEYLAKVIISVVVIILNYIFSKLFIFRKKSAE